MKCKKIISLLLSVIFFTSCLPFACFAASNEQIIYEYLKNNMTEMNSAAICGMMAGIKCESGFEPTAQYTEADGSVSYGICQWNLGRLESLKTFCSDNNLDYRTLNGQLKYLEYELKNTSEKTAYQLICSVADNQNGAYKAGYYCARYFERCAEKYHTMRAELARDTYWPKYGTSTPEADIEYTDIECGISYYIKNVGTGKYLSVDSNTDEKKINVGVAAAADEGRFRFVMNGESEGYAVKPEFATSTVVNVYGSVVKSGCNVCLWTRTGDASQHFNFESSGNAFIIRNVQNKDCVLDVSGSNVLVSTYSSSNNNQKWVLIPDTAPEKPVVLATASNDAAMTVIEWSAVKYADKYKVTLTNNDTGISSVLTETTTDNIFEVLLSAGNYSVTVTAYNTLLPFGSEKDCKTESDAYEFTVGTTHVHSFTGNTEVICPPTCTERGLRRTYCVGCDAYEETEIDATGHSYDGEVEEYVTATCTSWGINRLHCSHEGCDSYVEFDIEPLGHSFDGKTETSAAPSCTETGIERVYCSHSDCNEYEEHILEKTEHDYTTFKIECSYTSQGCTRHLCKNCLYYYDEDIVDAIPLYYGDVNGDGEVNVKDVLLTRKCASGIDVDDALEVMTRADVNADEEVNVKDVLIIRKFAAGLIDIFPRDEFYRN